MVSEYGVAIAEGIAGNETTMIAAPAPKHFSCYCGPENWGGIMRWTFDAVVPEKYLTSYFFPGWRATIRTGKVRLLLSAQCTVRDADSICDCTPILIYEALHAVVWNATCR